MDSQILIKLLLLVIFSILVGMIVYTVLSKDSDYVIERLKKGHAVKNKKGFLDDLLEAIKPMTEANMKSNKNKDEVKSMFVRLGMSATESDIMDFENRRMLRLIISAVMSSFCSLLLMFFLKDTISKMLICPIILCSPPLLAYRSPTWGLIRKIKKKAKAFEKYFPDAIDLLCVCVEAGLSIDSAIERVGREFINFSYEVGYEFNRIAKDMLSGVSKQDALKGLAERVDNQDIQSFVAIIVQADKMGASISNSLAISADSLRTKRKQRLEAQVASASTKMTIPLVLCLLPATFAVVLTPAIIQVVESLGKMHGF